MNKLELLRKLNGLSQAELAKRAGTYQSVVSLLERGYFSGTSPEIKQRIAKILDYPAEALFKAED